MKMQSSVSRPRPSVGATSFSLGNTIAEANAGFHFPVRNCLDLLNDISVHQINAARLWAGVQECINDPDTDNPCTLAMLHQQINAWNQELLDLKDAVLVYSQNCPRIS